MKLFKLLLHLNFLLFLSFDRVLELLGLSRDHSNLLIIFLQLGQLELDGVFTLSSLIQVCLELSDVLVNLEEEV